MLDTLNTSATFVPFVTLRICMSKLNKYKTALALLVLNTKQNKTQDTYKPRISNRPNTHSLH